MSTPPKDAPRAAIIIAAYNRRDDLAACLASLPWDSLCAQHIEVLVVDDGSTDGTADMVLERFPCVRLLRNDANTGASHARNQGAAATQTPLLVYIDSDVEVDKAWLPALIAADDGQTVLGGRILDYHDGHDQGGPRRATFLGKSLRSHPARANVAASCNLAAPRAAWEAIGGFDEDLPYYFEDRDFCIRARKAGYAFRYVPEAVLRHKGSDVRVGDAVRLQERHSVYAMLKAYRGRPLALAAFTLGTGAWLAARLMAWAARFRFTDCRRLLTGWYEAYRRFLTRREHW